MDFHGIVPGTLNKFIYFTLGKLSWAAEVCVVIVSTVVIPRATLAVDALASMKKEIQLRQTMSRVGMYVWMR